MSSDRPGLEAEFEAPPVPVLLEEKDSSDDLVFPPGVIENVLQILCLVGFALGLLIVLGVGWALIVTSALTFVGIELRAAVRSGLFERPRSTAPTVPEGYVDVE